MKPSRIDKLSIEEKDKILKDVILLHNLIKDKRFRFCESIHHVADGIYIIFDGKGIPTVHELHGDIVEDL